LVGLAKKSLVFVVLLFFEEEMADRSDLFEGPE